MTNNNGNPIEILLVEDNPGDVRLTEEVLKENKLCKNLSVARDGGEVLAFLRRKGKHSNSPATGLNPIGS